MLVLGFRRSKYNHCVYLKFIGDHLIYLVLYVDDRKQQRDDVKNHLSS
jgi:hypothetical protein